MKISKLVELAQVNQSLGRGEYETVHREGATKQGKGRAKTKLLKKRKLAIER